MKENFKNLLDTLFAIVYLPHKLLDFIKLKAVEAFPSTVNGLGKLLLRRVAHILLSNGRESSSEIRFFKGYGAILLSFNVGFSFQRI